MDVLSIILFLDVTGTDVVPLSTGLLETVNVDMTCEDVTSEDGAEGKTEVPLTIANLDLSDTYIKLLVTERVRVSDVAFTALDEYSTDDTDNKTDGLAITDTLELAINAKGVLVEKLLETAPWDTREDDCTNTRDAEDISAVVSSTARDELTATADSLLKTQLLVPITDVNNTPGDDRLTDDTAGDKAVLLTVDNPMLTEADDEVLLTTLLETLDLRMESEDAANKDESLSNTEVV